MPWYCVVALISTVASVPWDVIVNCFFPSFVSEISLTVISPLSSISFDTSIFQEETGIVLLFSNDFAHIWILCVSSVFIDNTSILFVSIENSSLVISAGWTVSIYSVSPVICSFFFWNASSMEVSWFFKILNCFTETPCGSRLLNKFITVEPFSQYAPSNGHAP